MKKVYNYWLPDSDNHFERLITKQVSKGGDPEYQDDVRDAAFQHVTDFDVCVDVGANIGFWAKPLSYKFNQVIAFEPIQAVLECLERNTQNCENIEINKFALGNDNSTINLIYDSENTGSTYVDKESLGQGSIEVKRLDDLNLPRFGMIKLDCEGYEIEVLRGGIETIIKYKPIVVVEQHEGMRAAGDFLKQHGAVELSRVRKDYIFGWKESK